MLDVNIDRSDPLPLHEQVAARIRRAIADGEAGPGERLPLAKDLAAVLGVNKNTVLRALHLLRDEGLLEFRRGRGITVAGTPQKTSAKTMPAFLQKVIAQWRNRVETTFKEITDQMELARHGAHSFWGLLTRTAATIAAHTLMRMFLAGLDQPT